MDKAQRAELLRQRFKATGGFAYVPSGKPVNKTPVRPKIDRLVTGWPQANRDTTRAGLWMHKPDPKPKVIPRPRRNAGAPVLTKVAFKAKRAKLPRLKLREPWECAPLKP